MYNFQVVQLKNKRVSVEISIAQSAVGNGRVYKLENIAQDSVDRFLPYLPVDQCLDNRKKVNVRLILLWLGLSDKLVLYYRKILRYVGTTLTWFLSELDITLKILKCVLKKIKNNYIPQSMLFVSCW